MRIEDDLGYRFRDVDVRKPNFRRPSRSGLSVGTIILIILGVKFGLAILICGIVSIGALLSPSGSNPTPQYKYAKSASPQASFGRGDPSPSFPEDWLERLVPNAGNTLAAFEFRDAEVLPQDAT